MDKEQLEDILTSEMKAYGERNHAEHCDNCNENHAIDMPDFLMDFADISDEDLQAIVDASTEHAYRSITIDAMRAALRSLTGDKSNEDESGFSIEDMIARTLASSIPFVIVGVLSARKAMKSKVSSKSVTFAMAEAQLTNYKVLERDTNAIWPEEIVKEVSDQYTPGEAFLIGVLCGRHDG